MKIKLLNEWQYKEPIKIMYDRAPNAFARLSLLDIHDLFSSQDFICHETQSLKSSTIITELIDDQTVQYRAHRPAVLVTSTSFTEDEDLGILLSAVQLYDTDLTPDTPDLVIFITGKGPLQEFYIQQVNTLKLKRVKIKMLWLKIEDYPKLLGSVDLGLSFHTSSSGLDLPMKIVDLFGCGTPVCALSYPCIDELVERDVNGVLFTNSQELTDHLINLLRDLPHNKKLKRLFEGVKNFQTYRWNECWNDTALECFKN